MSMHTSPLPNAAQCKHSLVSLNAVLEYKRGYGRPTECRSQSLRFLPSRDEESIRLDLGVHCEGLAKVFGGNGVTLEVGVGEEHHKVIISLSFCRDGHGERQKERKRESTWCQQGTQPPVLL